MIVLLKYDSFQNDVVKSRLKYRKHPLLTFSDLQNSCLLIYFSQVGLDLEAKDIISPQIQGITKGDTVYNYNK